MNCTDTLFFVYRVYGRKYKVVKKQSVAPDRASLIEGSTNDVQMEKISTWNMLVLSDLCGDVFVNCVFYINSYVATYVHNWQICNSSSSYNMYLYI